MEQLESRFLLSSGAVVTPLPPNPMLLAADHAAIIAPAANVASPAAAPTITNVVLAGTMSPNGYLEANQPGVITWVVTSSNPIALATLSIDGSPVTPLFGPNPIGGQQFTFAGTFAGLSAGVHKYSIEVIDSTGATANSALEFTVLPAAGLSISNVVVAPAAPQNGILTASQQGVISWVAGPNFVISSSLLIDNVAVAHIFGPVSLGPGQVAFAATFGPLAAGTHTATIRATDSTNTTVSQNVTFVVGPAAVPVISDVVVAGATSQNGALQDNQQGVISWLASPAPITTSSVSIDGTPVTDIFGPFDIGGQAAFSALFGPLAAGSHTYAIFK